MRLFFSPLPLLLLLRGVEKDMAKGLPPRAPNRSSIAYAYALQNKKKEEKRFLKKKGKNCGIFFAGE